VPSLLPLAASAALLLAGCAGSAVVVPPTDKTPPRVDLTSMGAGESITVNASTGPRSLVLDAGDVLFILAKAEDPEGVRRVTIHGELTTDCAKDGIVLRKHAVLLVEEPREADAGAVPGGTTLDARHATLLLEAPRDACPEGRTFLWQEGFLAATAENAHGVRVTTPAFSFGTDA
jgi:hypothetical protein